MSPVAKGQLGPNFEFAQSLFAEIAFKHGNIAKMAWCDSHTGPRLFVRPLSLTRATSGRYHTAVLTEDGRVFELGAQGRTDWEQVKLPSSKKQEASPIRSLACGGFRTIVLCEDGSVWRWSPNRDNNKIEIIAGLEGKFITKINCGLYECLALSGSKFLLKCKYAPKFIRFSWFHLANTETGEIFHWTNTDGHGDTPVKPLAGADGVTFYDVVSGKFGSAAITTTGEIWTWKTSSGGQNASVPTPIKSQLQGKYCRELSCGDLHFSALVSDAATGTPSVFGWGGNAFEQLGVKGVRSASEADPQVIIDLQGVEISQLRSGAYHSVALLGPWLGGSRFTLTSALREAARTSLLSDFQFTVAGLKEPKTWNVHKAILVTRSGTLAEPAIRKEILDGRLGRFELTGLEGKGLTQEHVESVIEYLYTDRCPMSQESVQQVSTLAHALKIPGLIEICATRLGYRPQKKQFPRLADCIAELLETQLGSDINFYDESETANPSTGAPLAAAHKFLLAARCPFYNAMWRQGWKEAEARQLPIPSQCSMGAFKSFLLFLYTDRLDVSGDDAVDLLALAHEMDLTSLKYACDRFIAEAIDHSTAVPLLQVALTYEANRLRVAALNILAANRALQKTQEFLALPAEIQQLVSRHKAAPVLPAAAPLVGIHSGPLRKSSGTVALEERRLALKSQISNALEDFACNHKYTELEFLRPYLDRINDLTAVYTTQEAQRIEMERISGELSNLTEAFPKAVEPSSNCNLM